jgi:hypothetical protein
MELRLVANPHFYDYIHKIILKPDGQCNFVDGGGQRINLNIFGTYVLSYETENHNAGSIEFKINNKNSKINFRIQEESIIMINEIVWNSSFSNWPISIYNKRYIFDVDPFDELYQNREYNLYFMLEGDKETEDSLKCFYSKNECCQKKACDLTHIELEKIKELNVEFYSSLMNEIESSSPK